MSRPDYGKCEEIINHSKIPVGEGGRKFQLLNPNNLDVRRIDLENCYLKQQKACDALLITPTNTEYYVEIKGKKIDDALEQILNSIEKASQNLPDTKRVVIVIASRVPKETTGTQKLKKRLKKFTVQPPIIKNDFYEEHLR